MYKSVILTWGAARVGWEGFSELSASLKKVVEENWAQLPHIEHCLALQP